MKIVQFFLLFCCSNFIYGQTNTANKGYAFYKAYLPGILRLDDNGDPVKPCVTLERIIYLECKAGLKLNVQEIKYNSLKLKVVDLKSAASKIVVGIKPSTGSPITIKAKKGYTFWILALETTCRDEKSFGDYLHQINIKAIVCSKPFNYFLKEEVELVAPETQ